MPKVKKPKKSGSKERLASPRLSKPRTYVRWSPTRRILDHYGKIIESSDFECKSDTSVYDDANASNPQEPTIKRFPNSTSFLGKLSKFVYGASTQLGERSRLQFYNSLSYNDQDSLNSAAGGNFLYKSPNEGLQIIENKAKVRCSRNAVMRVSTNAPPSSNSSSNFEFQQMAAALEDKMTLTFRNEMNEMKNMMKAFVPTPVPIKAVEDKPSTSTSMVPTTLPSNTITNPRGEVRAIRLKRGHSTHRDNSPLSKESSKKTKLPYPSRVEVKRKIQMTKCNSKVLGNVQKEFNVDITLADALILMPKYQKMLKSLLTNKDKLIEIAKTPMNANCSAVILKKLPEKLGDPGRFLIPCGFGEFDNHFSSGLGARINLMPLPRVPLILRRPFLRTARVLIDGSRGRISDKDGLERIVFKPDGSQDNESIHMMDVYDDRVKDVCEPESNDDSTTSAIVDEFESLLGDIIKTKEDCRGISDPVARRRACFANLDNFKTFSNPLFEKEDDFPSRNDESILKEEVHKETLKSYLNPLFEDDEENISNEVSKQISPKVNSEPSSEFLPKDDCDSDDDLFEIVLQ
ncbi:hypothetical protein Tco_0463018 [Tanacetum coccineum]